MEIIRMSVFAVICGFAAFYLKEMKSEFAPLMALAAGMFVLSGAAYYLAPLIASLKEIIVESGLSAVPLGIIFKVMATAYIASFAADICRDASQSGLASGVETFGRILIVYYTFPLAVSVFRMLAGIF